MAGSASLRGASAESLAALDERLRDAAGSGDAAELGEDLFAVATLLHRESGLRRTATDASLDGEARSGLMRSILEGKVSSACLDLVADAAARRWTTTRDLGDALEHLSVVATIRSAPDDADRLADELFGADRLLRTSDELRDALADGSRSAEDRAALVADIFGEAALPATTTLLQRAVTGSHRTVGVALEDYQRVAADVHAERVAVVKVAAPLDEAETERLRSALSAQYGRAVHLNVLLDPTVIGGMRVEIGDDVIDGTVSARLDDARRKLAG